MKNLFLFCCCFLFLTGCSRNPVSGNYDLNFYSDEQEIQIGEEYHPELVKQYGEYKDEKLQAYIQDMVTRMGDLSHRPNLEYRVTLLDTPEINAFAVPGGHVYICRGLLAYLNSEAELAGVMGHEIGHITARHSVQQMSQSSGFNLGMALVSIFLFKYDEDKQNLAFNTGQVVGNIALLSFSREDEMEADRLGLEYSTKAGFSPLGIGRTMTMFERLSGNGGSNDLATILSTHPTSATRTKQARIEVRKLEEQGNINRDLGRERYLDKIKDLNTSAKGKDVKPLQIYTVQKGDTWANLTAKYFGNADPKRLAWFNDCELNEPLPKRIKLGLF